VQTLYRSRISRRKFQETNARLKERQLEIDNRKKRRALRKREEDDKERRKKYRESRLQQKEQSTPLHDWVQCSDAHNNLYFYHAGSGETSWELPTDFHALLRNRYGDYDLTQQLQEAFHEFDTDGSGSIDKHELGALSAALGYPLDNRTLQQALSVLDQSGDGTISFEEFSWWWNGQY
jgi:hypothetical protein